MLSAENLLYNNAAALTNNNNSNNSNNRKVQQQQQDDINSISEFGGSLLGDNQVVQNNNQDPNQQQQQQQTALAGLSIAQEAKRRKAVSATSILGKIIVTDLPTGDKISQWGGVECYLSFISGHGPCLVVRGSRHKKGEGTFFQLRSLQRVLHQHVEQGKLTLQIPYMKRQCMIYITTTDPTSLPHLALMAATLDDPRRWSDLESNVGRGFGGGGGTGQRGRPRNSGGGNNAGEVEDGEAEVMVTKPSARDALLAQDQDLNFE